MEFLSDVSSGDDRYRPSFFELAAQEQLRDLLQPVVRYLLSVLAQRFPRYFLRFSNRHEETYAAMMLLVERHYLKNWSEDAGPSYQYTVRVQLTAGHVLPLCSSRRLLRRELLRHEAAAAARCLL